MKLTQPNVIKLKLPAGKADAIFFDDDIPGFGVRLRAGGTRTWIVQYRIAAKQRRQALGSAAVVNADKARAVAKKTLAKVTLGEGSTGPAGRGATALQDHARPRCRPVHGSPAPAVAGKDAV